MKTETPWIIRSLNASNCNGSATECVKEMLSALNETDIAIEAFRVAVAEYKFGIVLPPRLLQAQKAIRAAIAKAETL